MVFIDSHCLLCVGIQGFGKVPLEPIKAADSGMVGGGLIDVFYCSTSTPAKAYFLALFILILSTFISPLYNGT